MLPKNQPEEHPVNRVDFSAPANHTFQVSMAREEYPSDRRVRQFKDVLLFLFCLALASDRRAVLPRTPYAVP